MDLITQQEIFSDDLLHRYLRENSYWYKILNRNPILINKMKEEMKNRYKLNASDKIERIKDKLNMVESILEVLE